MDKGNHFYKCDLQIHSPRDRAWKGQPAISDDERNEYAKTFIKDCRKAGLDAIAISDHHDLVFFEYIKKASQEEKDEMGVVIPESGRLIVFPAVELTLNTPPIQGILVLDANFPESLFATVLGALSIAQAPKIESKTIETVGISQNAIPNINALYQKLDETNGVKGRYTFLPHIKEKGHKTMLRDGFHDSYARMPCVGGYVDGIFEGGSIGYLKILNGEVGAWGFKSMAVIQTSDHRAESTIWQNSIATWIKWAKPTAEALRQACLAKESRISLREPEIPDIFIEKVDVTASAFMGKFILDLNPQLNSIIGGRGTGKSTILEYIRWALCDQTEIFSDDEEKSEIQRKRKVLIEKTLKEHSAEVRISFMVNGTRHLVKRNSNSEDVLLKISDGEFQSVRPKQVQELLPIQAYSQKQLSSVAVRPEELKRFIEQPISRTIEEFDSRISIVASEIKKVYSNLTKNKQLISEIEKYNLELNSNNQQLQKLRSELKGMSEEDRKTIERATYFTNEKNQITEVEQSYSTVTDKLNILKDTINSLAINPPVEREYENKAVLDRIENERKTFMKETETLTERLLKNKDESSARFEEIKKEWTLTRNSFEDEYRRAKEKSTSSQQTITNIKNIETKIERLNETIRQKKNDQLAVNSTDGEYDLLYLNFLNLQKDKSLKLKEATSTFTQLSNGFIKADFANIVDSDVLTAQMNSIFSANSLGIHKTRAEQIGQIIFWDHDPLKKWGELILEFKTLVEFNFTTEGRQELPHTPILDSAGFTLANKRKCCEGLTIDSFLNMATIQIEYLPKFHYKTNNEMGDDIPFEDASAGQQATALLNVLLNQGGYPLIIDQPEDDIDNRAIDAIIINLWKAKRRRQIIFSSHNANLVVNGDSELVVCCDYNETSEQTSGYIKYQGSIDSDEIRTEITSIMEGGERAFKLRKEKYGF